MRNNFFLSTKPLQTIRKLTIKLNRELASLIMVQPQTQHISDRINNVMAKFIAMG
jgi:hypothetical protein